MHVSECLEAVRRFMDSDFEGPMNIGSEEMVTINELAQKIMKIANKNLTIKHVDGPLGVRGRNSDNKLIEQKLGWKPTLTLEEGLKRTYTWINRQVEQAKQKGEKIDV